MSDEAARTKQIAHVREEAAQPRPSVTAALASLGIPANGRVLDAGCGPGPHLGLLLDAVGPRGTVEGLDLDADSLAVAAEVWDAAVAAGRLRLHPGDLMDLPFADASFDLSWTSLALHHVPEPAVALRELARVVVPGGMVAVLDADASAGVPLLPWPPEIEARLRAALVRGAAENYGGKLDYVYHPFLGRDLTRLLREAGLTRIRSTPSPTSIKRRSSRGSRPSGATGSGAG